MKKVLTIAGFDGSGGAGIQADLKTFSAFGCYGTSVLTALPVQNTLGVRNCYEIPLKAIEEQLSAIFDDIIPDSIKIGMLFKSEIIELVADFLKKEANSIPIILDPVMVAKSGDRLLLSNAIDALKTQLIPLAAIITPNLPEAYELTGINATTPDNMLQAANQLLKLRAKSVLLKGGHLEGNECSDLYINEEGISTWLKAERIITSNTHGTGCTLSAAIASCLAHGMGMLEACKVAKYYLYNALKAASNKKIGLGKGSVHHFYHLWPTTEKSDNKNSKKPALRGHLWRVLV